MSVIRSEYFESSLSKDFFDLLVGQHLGAGVGRQVYACKLDPTIVLKIEAAAYSFQNQAEWEVWDQVKKTKIARWFAPLVRISPCGMILVQKRTAPILPSTRMPEKIPGVFGDIKKENWGLLDGKVVCHDYGRTNVFFAGWNGITRMKKAKWWSSQDGHFNGGASTRSEE